MKQPYITQLKESFHLLWKNKRLGMLAVLVDLLFFYGFGKVYAKIFLNVSDHLNTVNTILNEELPKLQTTTNINSVLLSNPDFAAAYRGVLYYIFLTILFLYLFWTIFQGINWFIACKINKKTSFLNYISRFAWLNLVWLGAFLLIVSFSGYLLSKSVASPLPLFGQGGIKAIAGILSLALLYFMIISYSLIPKKKTLKNSFITGWKKAKTALPMYLIILAILYFLNYLLLQIYLTNSLGLLIAYGLLIVLPALIYLRIYAVRTVQAVFLKTD